MHGRFHVPLKSHRDAEAYGVWLVVDPDTSSNEDTYAFESTRKWFNHTMHAEGGLDGFKTVIKMLAFALEKDAAQEAREKSEATSE